MALRRAKSTIWSPPNTSAMATTPSAVLTAILGARKWRMRSEEHTSELQALRHLVCRLLLVNTGMAALQAGDSQAPALAGEDRPARDLAPGNAVDVFFLNDTAPTEIYTLSLHDALPIFCRQHHDRSPVAPHRHRAPTAARYRSEEHTSELQSLRHLVCRLLLEKKDS